MPPAKKGIFALCLTGHLYWLLHLIRYQLGMLNFLTQCDDVVIAESLTQLRGNVMKITLRVLERVCFCMN